MLSSLELRESRVNTTEDNARRTKSLDNSTKQYANKSTQKANSTQENHFTLLSTWDGFYKIFNVSMKKHDVEEYCVFKNVK